MHVVNKMADVALCLLFPYKECSTSAAHFFAADDEPPLGAFFSWSR